MIRHERFESGRGECASVRPEVLGEDVGDPRFELGVKSSAAVVEGILIRLRKLNS